jgi:hypothetical protein
MFGDGKFNDGTEYTKMYVPKDTDRSKSFKPTAEAFHSDNPFAGESTHVCE